MQNPVGKIIQQERLSEAQMQVMKDAKARVGVVIQHIKNLEKINGSTKKSKKAIKTLEEFMKCYITNPAIYVKYQAVMHLMEEYANAVKHEG